MVQSNYSRASDLSHDVKECRFKYITSQVMAAVVGTLLTINVSSMTSITTMVNGALRVNATSTNMKNEVFIISDTQATLYATILVIVNLLASILSGIYQDMFGRKNCLLVSTLPQILSWIILYFSQNAYWLYVHALAVGIGTAFCEHVVVTYVSEIASVDMRGRLFSVGKFGYGIGSFLTFLLGNFHHWRTLSLGLAALPIILPFYLLWLPESPLWLLSKGRDKECRKSLMWLRGWTTSQNVEVEYQKLLTQLKERKAESEKTPRCTSYIKLCTKAEFLEPFKLALILLFSSFLLSLRGARFYFINFLHKLGVQADKMKIMTLNGFCGILGCIVLVITVRKFGKRALTLWTFSASAVTVCLLSLYSTLHNTYNLNAVWIIYMLSGVLHFLGGYTLGGMPWFIISEIFPQRYRGLCSGIAGMFGHIMITVLTGTFLPLERRVGTTNVLYLYSFTGLICIFYLFKHLPETENKSLHEIEEYFKNRNKKHIQDAGLKSVWVKLCPTDSVSTESKGDTILSK